MGPFSNLGALSDHLTCLVYWALCGKVHTINYRVLTLGNSGNLGVACASKIPHL